MTSLRTVALSAMRGFGIVAVALLTQACDDDSDDGGPDSSSTATVAFGYLAATSIDPAVQSAFPACVAGVGRTHIHPSWRGFVRIDMTPVGADRWEISLNDVPANEFVRIRISDPNVCAENPTGAATQNAFANGVELTQVVDTPGNGIEPGLGFSVAPDGTVTP